MQTMGLILVRCSDQKDCSEEFSKVPAKLQNAMSKVVESELLCCYPNTFPCLLPLPNTTPAKSLIFQFFFSPGPQYKDLSFSLTFQEEQEI